jgi:hypothetical protein
VGLSTCSSPLPCSHRQLIDTTDPVPPKVTLDPHYPTPAVPITFPSLASGRSGQGHWSQCCSFSTQLPTQLPLCSKPLVLIMSLPTALCYFTLVLLQLMLSTGTGRSHHHQVRSYHYSPLNFWYIIISLR